MPEASATSAGVPRMVRFNGSVRTPEGTEPGSVANLTFAIYSERDSVSPIWAETRSVTLDANGRYAVLLGATGGELPASIFSTTEARWIGVRTEDGEEMPRILLVSVPYALKSGDADTLGGLPASAFQLAGSAVSQRLRSSSSSSISPETGVPAETPGGTVNRVAKFSSSTNLVDSSIFDNGSVGIGTTSPAAKLDVQHTTATPFNAANASVTLTNSAPISGSVVSAFQMTLNDSSTSSNLSKQSARFVYIRDGAATGTVAAFDSIMTSTAFIVNDAPYQLRGMNIEGPTVVSGKTLSNFTSVFLGGGSGTVTNKFAVVADVGAGNSGFGLTNPSTRVEVLENNGTQAIKATQQGVGGVSFSVSNPGTTAILGDATNANGATVGVQGISSSDIGRAVVGKSLATSGTNMGVFGVSLSSNGTGVWGESTSTAATNAPVGVYGTAVSTVGTGVWGEANASSGDARGVFGRSASSAGTGVYGEVTASSGDTRGVYGRTSSTGGAAGMFDNTASGGNVIIGRFGSTNVFRVATSGQVFGAAFNTSGADFAESVSVRDGKSSYQPGDVMAVDTEGVRRFTKSSAPYSTLVAGIYSTKPGILATPHHIDDQRPQNEEVPLAVVGIVPCKVSNENGAIKAGDLLVSSSTPGYAMKGTDRKRMTGAVIGKALQNMSGTTGVIEVLVSLQ